MMKKVLVNIVIIFFEICFLSSCEVIENKHVIYRYYVTSLQVPQDRQLSYKLEDGNYVGIVEPYLNKVGTTNSFLVVMQNPVNTFEIDSAVDRYFLVPIRKEYTLRPEEGVIGPMTKQDFLLKSSELNIGDITWKSFE